jgi:hypothetical protein
MHYELAFVVVVVVVVALKVGRTLVMIDSTTVESHQE